MSASQFTRRTSSPASTHESTLPSTARRYEGTSAKSAQPVKTKRRPPESWGARASEEARLRSPSPTLFEVARGLVDIVAEDEEPAMQLRLLEQPGLLLEDSKRVNVGGHVPRD